MLDIVTETSNKRGELLSYIKSKVSESSYIWSRNLLSDITKKVLTMKDDEFSIRVYPMYKNCLKFFTTVCDEVTPGGILLTLYLCALELGIRKVGDSVEKLDEFTAEIDMDDWGLMSADVATNFDLYTSALLLQRHSGMAKENGVWACGLHTLNMLDFIKV